MLAFAKLSRISPGGPASQRLQPRPFTQSIAPVHGTRTAEAAYPRTVERVKLIDVAREAGVHTATASRALNPAMRGGVSRKTVRRVEQAAQRLGYVPNALARGLRTARSNVIALIIPDITNALFPALVRGAAQVLDTAGYTLVLTDTNNDPAAEHAQLASMRPPPAGRTRSSTNWPARTSRWCW